MNPQFFSLQISSKFIVDVRLLSIKFLDPVPNPARTEGSAAQSTIQSILIPLRKNLSA